MELLFLDENFQLASHPIDRYYSLQWAENYYDEGTFELHLAADLFPTVLRSEYVYNNEADEAMLIDDVQASDDGKQTLKLSGKSLDTLLRHRVMDEVDSFTGTVEDIARQAVQKYAIASDRSVSLLRLGTRKGYTDTAVATNERGAELYEWLRELLKPYEMSFCIHYNFEDNALDFEVYRGLDRTQEQTTNTWAIFSTSFENLSQFSYARNRSDYRNYAIVMTDDGTKRVTVDKTGGAPRRELFVSADDELDTAAMTQLGESALAEYAMIETVSGEVQGGANMIYGENYALGDLCNIEDTHLGVSAAARLTQMTTVVEKGVTRRVPSFGEQYLSLRRYIARATRKTSSGSVAYVGEDTTLPEGYTLLNYLQSNGEQYLDLGFAPNQDTRVVVDCQVLSIDGLTSNGLHIASVIGTSYFWTQYIGSNGRIGTRYGTQSPTLFTADKPLWSDRLVYDKNKNVTTVGGYSISANEEIFELSYNIYLFARNNKGTMDYGSTARVYSCRAFDDGGIIRNMIPCINPSGAYGMYDKVNAKFYGNAGTGSFTGG